VDALDPAGTALLVMDYQNGILGRYDAGDELVGRATAAIEAARRAGATVGYVRVALDEAEAASVPASNKMFGQIAARGGMGADDPATAVVDAIAPQDGDIVVRKKRVGAFSTTDLAEQLQDRGIDTLLLAGVSTSGVVLSTLRDAADHDYRLVVLEDLCADADPEVHRVLVEKVFPRQADVLSSKELPALLPAQG
jgi:nicotinamidase-related amidase